MEVGNPTHRPEVSKTFTSSETSGICLFKEIFYACKVQCDLDCWVSTSRHVPVEARSSHIRAKTATRLQGIRAAVWQSYPTWQQTLNRTTGSNFWPNNLPGLQAFVNRDFSRVRMAIIISRHKNMSSILHSDVANQMQKLAHSLP
jgi:hypothetical protein